MQGIENYLLFNGPVTNNRAIGVTVSQSSFFIEFGICIFDSLSPFLLSRN